MGSILLDRPHSESSATKTAIASCNAPIGSWDVSHVTNFREAFQDTNAFNQDLSGWDVTGADSSPGLNGMFYSAAAFNQDLSAWDVTKVPTFAHTFTGAGLSKCAFRRSHEPLMADADCVALIGDRSHARRSCNKRAIYDSWSSQHALFVTCGYSPAIYCSYNPSGWSSLC